MLRPLPCRRVCSAVKTNADAASSVVSLPRFFQSLLTDATILACRNFKFEDVHIAGAERIAQVAAEAGVPRLIHVSALNASPTSFSRFYKTKYEGEQRVKAAYPNATIVRPAQMYGYEDRFLNNMASEL